jgi:hypothetical protein
MDATISQRHIVLIFVKEFVKQHTFDEPIPRIIIPDSYNDDHAPNAGDIDMTSMITVPTI